MTRNGGAAWTDVTAAIEKAGGPRDRWVSRVFASSHQPGTAYVAKNGYRHDDFAPYLFRTADYGATWTSIGQGLPDQPINVVWQDRRNPGLLFAGNDKGVWVSLDDGARWVRMKGNMPERAGARSAGASARAGSRRGHVRAGDLHHQRVGAAATG